MPPAARPAPAALVLTAERHAALREAFAALPPSGQRLIALLLEDPSVPYAQISARLGIPVGSIGPARRHCLDKLRRHPAIAALMNTGTTAADEMRGLPTAIVMTIRPVTPSELLDELPTGIADMGAIRNACARRSSSADSAFRRLEPLLLVTNCSFCSTSLDGRYPPMRCRRMGG